MLIPEEMKVRFAVSASFANLLKLNNKILPEQDCTD